MEIKDQVGDLPTMQTLYEGKIPPPYVDDIGGGVKYVGYAAVGVQTDAECWRILKYTTVGSLTTVTYPKGDFGFVHIWDNRATYEYGR